MIIVGDVCSRLISSCDENGHSEGASIVNDGFVSAVIFLFNALFFSGPTSWQKFASTSFTK